MCISSNFLSYWGWISKKKINEASHFLCGFLLSPKRDPGSLPDKIGNLHNGATSTAQECRSQNAGHSQGKAAQNAVLSLCTGNIRMLYKTRKPNQNICRPWTKVWYLLQERRISTNASLYASAPKLIIYRKDSSFIAS